MWLGKVFMFYWVSEQSLPVPYPAVFEWQAAAEGRHKVTMIPGDGVGPELMSAVRAVFSAAAVPVDFEEIIARYL